MKFKIFGGNTKVGLKKEEIVNDLKYEIPPGVTHIHVYNGWFCFGKVIGIKHLPKVITDMETKDGSRINIMTTNRGKFIEIPKILPGNIKAIYVSFPKWKEGAGIEGIIPEFHSNL